MSAKGQLQLDWKSAAIDRGRSGGTLSVSKGEHFFFQNLDVALADNQALSRCVNRVVAEVQIVRVRDCRSENKGCPVWTTFERNRRVVIGENKQFAVGRGGGANKASIRNRKPANRMAARRDVSGSKHQS